MITITIHYSYIISSRTFTMMIIMKNCNIFQSAIHHLLPKLCACYVIATYE